MDSALAWLVAAIRRARFVFTAVYALVGMGYLVADPRAGWTWFILVAGGLLCAAFWGAFALWSPVLTRRTGSERRNGTDHG